MSTHITYGNIDLRADPAAMAGFVLVAVGVVSLVHRLFFSFLSTFPDIEGYKSTRQRFVNDAFNLVKAGFAEVCLFPPTPLGFCVINADTDNLSVQQRLPDDE